MLRSVITRVPALSFCIAVSAALAASAQPANFAGDLPSPEDIAARLQAWSGLQGDANE